MPLSWAGTSFTRPVCSKLHLTWSWTLPGVRLPHLLWATSCSISPSSHLPILPNIQSKPSIFSLKPFLLFPSLHILVKTLHSFFSRPPFRYWKAVIRFSLENCLLQAAQSQICQSFYIRRGASSLWSWGFDYGHSASKFSQLVGWVPLGWLTLLLKTEAKKE